MGIPRNDGHWYHIHRRGRELWVKSLEPNVLANTHVRDLLLLRGEKLQMRAVEFSQDVHYHLCCVFSGPWGQFQSYDSMCVQGDP